MDIADRSLNGLVFRLVLTYEGPDTVSVKDVRARIHQEILLVKNRSEADATIKTRLDCQNLVALPYLFLSQLLYAQRVGFGLIAHHLKFFVVVV